MATRALFVGLLLCLLQLFHQAAADTYGRATYYWDNNQVIISFVDAGGGHHDRWWYRQQSDHALNCCVSSHAAAAYACILLPAYREAVISRMLAA
jgi:hypothetical protein